MTATLACPKCRQGMPDDALDAGQCPACGFPLDGPLAFRAPGGRRGPWLIVAGVGAAVAFAGGVGAGLLHKPEPAREVVSASPVAAPVAKVRHVAPFPHEPRPREPQLVEPKEPPTPKPVPVVVVEPKKDGPRPVGVVMRIDPKIAPVRHFDQPDDTATLPDLNSGDKVVLTGRLRTLRVGSVNGKASLDASGLTAEEIVITGDLNGEAAVKLHAPGGTVALGGYVGGASRLTVVAPGGAVRVAEASGRLTGSAVTQITAKRVEVAGKAMGGARLDVTLTAGGSLKLATVEEGAVVTYRKFAATDPAPIIEKGTTKGGGKVLAE